MFEEESLNMTKFVTTLNKVIKNLSTIEDCTLEELEERVTDEFDGYHYEGEEEVVGFDSWGDISSDGEYELKVKVDHEDAYELTLYVTVKGKKATVTNVL